MMVKMIWPLDCFPGEETNMEGAKRAANIVYFLSRNGKVEQPHLIRIHDLHRDGVHLRDVKRWIAEVRGKDMTDSFAWSCKRLYKNGYVWQDLKDDDLIAPITDNEYVLKGSLLQFYSTLSKGAEKVEEPELDSNGTDQRMAVVRSDPSTKSQDENDQQRFKRRYSHVFRNILKCRNADANDSVLMPMAGGHGHQRRRSTSDLPSQQQPHQQGSETDDNNNSRKSWRSGSKNGGSSASYKPFGAPNCSQCARPFDPEKLHSHMQSCRALRGGRGKGRIISTDKVPSRRRESCSEDDFSRESISGYLT